MNMKKRFSAHILRLNFWAHTTNTKTRSSVTTMGWNTVYFYYHLSAIPVFPGLLLVLWSRLFEQILRTISIDLEVNLLLSMMIPLFLFQCPSQVLHFPLPFIWGIYWFSGTYASRDTMSNTLKMCKNTDILNDENISRH